MFKPDIYIHTLANLLQPKLRYLGDRSFLLCREMLREDYILVTMNLKRTRETQPQPEDKVIIEKS